MEAYLRDFVNFEQNNWARFLSMAKFAYNNAKNASTGHTPFKLNCSYQLQMLYKDDVNPYSKSKSADKLSAKLKRLMIVCKENLYHAQKLQKQGHNKNVKPWSYAFGNKIWLNSKYIKTKRNQKLEAQFFGLFRVLHPVRKQTYKLKLLKNWRIHNIFHLLLLEQDTTRKRRVDENNATELDAGNKSGEYKVEAIYNNTIYAKELEDNPPGLYYLIYWKGYSEEENIWEPASAVQYFRKFIRLFHQDHPNRPIATFSAIDTAPLLAKPTVQLSIKQKQSQSINSSNK